MKSQTSPKKRASIKALRLSALICTLAQPLWAHPDLKGFALRSDQGASCSEIQAGLRDLKDLGANAVLLKVGEFQDDYRSDFIYPDPEATLSLSDLSFAIDEARRNRMEVVLMPIVLLKKTARASEWRGMIEPRDRERWFNSYQSMLLKYAALAQEHHVRMFSVGSELSSMEIHWEFWSRLIDEVRSRFRGSLIYSFNWDHTNVTPAWRGLDYVGVSAYYELSGSKENPGVSDLVERWGPIRSRLTRWSQAVGKPLVITEVGYPSRVGGLFHPWDHTMSGGIPDEETQWKGFRAFIDTWSDEPQLAGVLFYEWHDPTASDSGYSPKGKKAEPLFRNWFLAPAHGVQSAR